MPPKTCPPAKIFNPATGRCVKKDGRVGKIILGSPVTPKTGKRKTQTEQEVEEVDGMVRRLGLWKPMPKSIDRMSRPTLVSNFKKFRNAWERLAGWDQDMPDPAIYSLTDKELRDRLKEFYTDDYRELARKTVSDPRRDILKQLLEIGPYFKSIEF